jgi:hypothetical protein
MGISTLQSYQGSRYLKLSASINTVVIAVLRELESEGIGFDEISKEALIKHNKCFPSGNEAGGIAGRWGLPMEKRQENITNIIRISSFITTIHTEK